MSHLDRTFKSAQSKGLYSKVTRNSSGKFDVKPTRKLSSAYLHWSKGGIEADWIAVHMFRLIGHPSDIREYLSSQNVPPKQIDEAIKTAFHKNNYLSAEFKSIANADDMVHSQYRASQASKSKSRTHNSTKLSLEDLAWLSKGMTSLKHVPAKNVTSRSGKHSHRGPRKSLVQKLEALKKYSPTDPHVLDVTNITENEEGIHTVKMPKYESARNKKRMIDNLPIQADSDKPESYALAMRLLGPEYLAHAEKFRSMGPLPASLKKSTRRKRSKSPKSKSKKTKRSRSHSAHRKKSGRKSSRSRSRTGRKKTVKSASPKRRSRKSKSRSRSHSKGRKSRSHSRHRSHSRSHHSHSPKKTKKSTMRKSSPKRSRKSKSRSPSPKRRSKSPKARSVRSPRKSVASPKSK